MSVPKWWDAVVNQVKAYQEENPANLPGAVFGAETLRDGRLTASVGEGWSNNTICAIGSIGKVFIATSVLLALEEKGLLDIETPVYKLPGMELYADDRIKKEIKVRHLLQHTSGLPTLHQKVENQDDKESGDVGRDLDLGPTVPWVGAPGLTNELVFADGRWQPGRQLSLDKVSQHVMQSFSPDPEHQPGTQFCYSNLNYIVAARIVEKLTGKSVNIHIKEKLSTPLGLKDSFFIAQKTGDPATDARIDEGVSDEQRGRIADVIVLTQDGKYPPEVAPGPGNKWDKFRKGWRYVYPDGGMYSTVDDLLTFLAMLRDGGMSGSQRILSQTVVSLLVDNHGFGQTMGLAYRGKPTPYGQGAGTIEHMGNLMTHFWYDPKPGNPVLGVFLSQRLTNVAVNNNMADGMKVMWRIFLPQVNEANSDHNQQASSGP